MSAKWLFTFKHFKFPLLPLLTHSAMAAHTLAIVKYKVAMVTFYKVAMVTHKVAMVCNSAILLHRVTMV